MKHFKYPEEARRAEIERRRLKLERDRRMREAERKLAEKVIGKHKKRF